MTDVKLIALYFPQFHAIPENSEWWGDGFTDWVNVKKATPLFEGHNQPRIPLNSNYYDQSNLDVLHWQVNLAKKYGVYGFCHYHYWFDGKQLLETPTNLMLSNKSIDMPFCLSWANETWSRRWDGQDHHILIKQTHPPTKESWSRHFDYLIKAWTDIRAIKIEGKPVFIIYRPHKIKKLDQMLYFWREKALKHGLKGLYFIAQLQYDIPIKYLKAFDAIFQFQPFESTFSNYSDNGNKFKMMFYQLLRRSPGALKIIAKSVQDKIKNAHTIYNYDEIWKKIIDDKHIDDLTVYKGAFIDWDNTARYGDKAMLFRGANPDNFKYWFGKLVDKVLEQPKEERFIFINAWNEWSEGAYLEPDTVAGYEYLDAIKKIIQA